jgi:hypothetical protein
MSTTRLTKLATIITSTPAITSFVSSRLARLSKRACDTSLIRVTKRTFSIRLDGMLSKVDATHCFQRQYANMPVVFQYTYKRPGEDKEYVVVWDYNVGLVRMTPFFKSCKFSKVCCQISLLASRLTIADCAGEGTEPEFGHEGNQLQHYWRVFGLSRLALLFYFAKTVLTYRRLLGSVAGRS